MKKYKLVDKMPYHAAAYGAAAGSSIGATSVTGMVVGGLAGAAVGLGMGGTMALKDAKHRALNEKQFGKKN